MKLICSDFIITCDDNFNIIENGAILFDKNIKKVATKEELLKESPEAELIELEKNSVIMPSFSNPHVHLEFSGNKTTLKYSKFIDWLNSVIEHREDLIEKCSNTIETAIDEMLKSGIGTIGAVSSYGFDLEAVTNSKLKTVFFNEAIGSKPDMVDALYGDFLSRLGESQKHNSDRFRASIAIHSPYSIHPILTKKILQIAKDENILVSSHFLESKAEIDWLTKSKGDFVDFFKNFLNQSKSLITPIEFINQFRDVKALFVHNLEADEAIFNEMKNFDIDLITCPRSNRFLNNRVLDLDKVKDFNLSIATDGLSSNSSLNMFDELRASLLSYPTRELNSFAKELLLQSTKNPAKSLGFNNGEIRESKSSDFIAISLPDKTDIESLPLNIILHTKEVTQNYIDGERII